MTKEALKIISDDMERLNINYELGEWTSDVVYPYFTGEYQEVPTLTEDGLTETQFIFNGFSRGSWIDLVNAKETIENLYNKVSGRLVTADNNTVVAIFYDSSLVIPTGDAELKRIQVNIKIKEWKAK